MAPTNNTRVAPAFTSPRQLSRNEAVDLFDEMSGSDRTQAPAAACTFGPTPVVTFAEAADGKENAFEIVGYSGEVIRNHWWWGNLAFDLQGLKFAGKKTPVLDSHFTDRRVGFATKQGITDKVTFEGQFLSNDSAQQLRADLREGFPMQASLYLVPRVVEYVKEGGEVTVNGTKLKGPGAVFRQAQIKEVSMCVFGADEKTSSAALAASGTADNITFAIDGKDPQMGKTVETGVEQFDRDEVLADGRAEGVTSERDRFAALGEICGDDHDLLIECFASGATPEETSRLRTKRLAAENAQLKAAAKPTTPARGQAAGDEAVTEFTEQPAAAAATPDPAPDDVEGLTAKFKADADLRAEFGGDLDAYLAFVKAESEDLVKIR